MFITVKTHPKQVKLNFEELLNNPYIASNRITIQNPKVVTIEITEEYGRQLFEKTYGVESYFPRFTTLPYTEIPNNYRHFYIKKKSNPNKRRRIDAPSDQLKNIQLHYKALIEDTLRVLPHKNAGAYVKKKSIIHSMEKHQRNQSNWYLQIDLKDFFPSINEEFMRKQLQLIYPFKFLHESVLEDIIQYSLLQNKMPQGSCLSPTMTNVLMVPIDHEITETLHNYKHHHYVYTRYADDITISCKEKFDPEEIIRIIEDIFNKYEAPFRINNEKTRFGSRMGKNYHLGLIVNKDNQISIGHEKNNKFRAMLYNFIMVGDQWELHDIHKMLGLISYYKSIEPNFVNKTIEKYNTKYNCNIIENAKRRIYGNTMSTNQ